MAKDFDDKHRGGLNCPPNKSKEVETMPLFLSENYKQIYDRSAHAMANFNRSPGDAEKDGKQTIDERKKAKGITKIYRSQWLQEKLLMQNERRRARRGQKQPKKEETVIDKKDTDPKRAGAKGGKGGVGKAKKDAEVDMET
jgi:hypothetical protein